MAPWVLWAFIAHFVLEAFGQQVFAADHLLEAASAQ